MLGEHLFHLIAQQQIAREQGVAAQMALGVAALRLEAADGSDVGHRLDDA